MTGSPRQGGNGPRAHVSPRVLYETDDYLGVDKPEGVLAVAQAGEQGLPDLLRDHHPGKLYPVHRLDRGASGVIVFAKNAAAHRHLNGEFDRRGVRKTYLALVEGVPAQNRGRVNAPIREFGSGRMGVDPKRGKPSSTEWKVAERLDGATLLRVNPGTGRRHQIRVHLYHIGHPILGDLRYGDRARQEQYPRLMLHALSLAFALPSGESVTIEAPPPLSFEAVLAGLRMKKQSPSPVSRIPSRGGEGIIPADPRGGGGTREAGGTDRTGSRGAGEPEDIPEPKPERGYPRDHERN